MLQYKFSGGVYEITLSDHGTVSGEQAPAVQNYTLGSECPFC